MCELTCIFLAFTFFFQKKEHKKLKRFSFEVFIIILLCSNTKPDGPKNYKGANKCTILQIIFVSLSNRLQFNMWEN